MKYYNNKIAFVTGGSSGIGLSTAMLLSSFGADVIIFARDNKKLNKAIKEISAVKKNSTQRFKALRMNVSNDRDVKKKIKSAIEAYGTPDILVNSAGIAYCGKFENISYKIFDDVIKTDLYGIWNVTSAITEPMKKKGRGHIVNISSVAGFIGVFGYTAYSAAKYGVIGFSECLRSELKPYNINVSVLCPPDTETPQHEEELNNMPDETRAISSNAGLCKPEYVARQLLKKLVKKKFIITTGIESKFIYLAKRFLPGISEYIMDKTIKNMQSRNKKK